MTEREDGSFRVTTRDVYDAVQGLREDLAPLKDLPDTVKDHDVRIRSLERKLATIIGVGLVLELLVTPIVVYYVVHVMTTH